MCGYSLFEPCCCLCCGHQAALRARVRMQLLSLQAIVYLSVHTHVHMQLDFCLQTYQLSLAYPERETVQCWSHQKGRLWKVANHKWTHLAGFDIITDLKQILMNVGSELDIEVRQQLLNWALDGIWGNRTILARLYICLFHFHCQYTCYSYQAWREWQIKHTDVCQKDVRNLGNLFTLLLLYISHLQHYFS